MTKKIIHLTGGLGRVISATGAVRRFAEKHPNDQIIILTSWPDVFQGNPYIYKLYGLNQPYLWDDIIQHGEFIDLEPYWDHHYYNQKHNLATSFNFLLNGEAEFVKPELFLTEAEVKWGQEVRAGIEAQLKTTIFGTFQAYGAGAKGWGVYGSKQNIIDDSNRSLPQLLVEKIATLNKEISFFNYSPFFLDYPTVGNRTVSIREAFGIINASDFFLGIDSSGLHAAAAFGKPGLIILGSTYKENVSYPHYLHVSRPGFPKSYVPNRFAGAIDLNSGAMDLGEVEIEQIRQFLTPTK